MKHLGPITTAAISVEISAGRRRREEEVEEGEERVEEEEVECIRALFSLLVF